MNLDLCLSSYIKVSSQWITDLNIVRPETKTDRRKYMENNFRQAQAQTLWKDSSSIGNNPKK